MVSSASRWATAEVDDAGDAPSEDGFRLIEGNHLERALGDELFTQSAGKDASQIGFRGLILKNRDGDVAQAGTGSRPFSGKMVTAGDGKDQ